MKIALLGAESTGKTQLAQELAAHTCGRGLDAIAVDEYLRLWCEEQARTPTQDEQTHIAHTQQARIAHAAKAHAIVFADTTPLMTAVYSEFMFADTRLHEEALAYQRSFDLTLLTGLDMPWQADGIQRDGEHVRGPVDALLRSLLQEAGIRYEVIYGLGAQRLKHGLQATERVMRSLASTNHSSEDTINTIALRADSMTNSGQKGFKKWQWMCDKCSDPQCEYRLFLAALGEE